MLRTFNCGQGFLVIVPKDQKDKALDAISQTIDNPVVLGHIIKDENKQVAYTGVTRYAAIS